MSRTLFLSPHNDDETLFGSFTLIRENPLVFVCLRSYTQDRKHGFNVTYEQREEETAGALDMLGVECWAQGVLSDLDPDWDALHAKLWEYARYFDQVYAPAVEEHGHPHHNKIGEMADEIFGTDQVTHYMTYTNGRNRSEGSRVVKVEKPEWVVSKLLALACYPSQIKLESTGHHFMQALTEWYE